MYHKTKRYLHVLLHPTEGETKWDKILNGFLVTLILLNVAAVMLETEAGVYRQYKSFFDYFDLVSVIIFTIEYLLRVWSCTHDRKYSHWFWARIRYMLTWGALIDLAAILPFYLHRFLDFDLRVLRILRLLRLLRIFRLTAYMKSSRLVANVFRHHKQELLLSLVLMTGLIIISSCVMYFAEHHYQPDKFRSIPDTLWWSIVTLTTIGYGDMVPMTGIGRILTSVIALAGFALFALPAGIITAGFLQETRRTRRKKVQKCPHCGGAIHLSDDHDEDG